MSTSSNTTLAITGALYSANHVLGNIYTSNTNGSYNLEPFDVSKSPFCRISLTKSENNGIVMELRMTDKYSMHSSNEPKVYVISSVENLGKEIQNAVAMEIMKQ